MPRLLLILLLASATSTAKAEDAFDPNKLAAVKKALEKLEADIRKNRKDFDDANAAALAEAEKALKEEVDRLAKADKLEEAVAVKKLAASLKTNLPKGAEPVGPAAKKKPPPGAVRWNGHRYMAFRDACRWQEAKERCEAMGGHLVIIETVEEQNALQTMLTRVGLANVWTGATDEAEEGVWTWVDGSPVKFSFWHGSQPDNSGGAQHYALLASGRWDDQANDVSHGFLCEWDD